MDERDGGILTTTSRALAVVGIADSLSEAEAVAETGLRHVKGDYYVRHDIGTSAAIQRKVDRMRRLRGG